MNKLAIITLILLHVVKFEGTPQIPSGGYDGRQEQAIAFPGAEGFGKFSSGGRGGKVYIVSTLEDDGPGSFRQAAEAKGPRIVTFSISGTIRLLSPVSMRGDITIAGQTAPGDGVCIADHPVMLDGDNIIIRYMRFRMGDRYQDKGKVPGSGHDDALSATRRSRIIIDHCSISWSTDECMSVYGGDSTTLQWNIISEPLNHSYHFEAGDKDYERHGYGGIWGGAHLTAHHNLFAHCVSRNPRFNGARIPGKEEFVDFRNNVIYDWGGNNVYGGEGGRYNIVNNYYRYGPSTGRKVMYRIVNPWRNKELSFGRFHVAGNHVDGSSAVTQNNAEGVHIGEGGSDMDKPSLLVDKPFEAMGIPVRSAKDALSAVMQHGGCSLPVRDTLDQRILRELHHREGRIIDVQGGYPHGTAFELTKTAWPALRSLPSKPDTDRDAMPDAWEVQNGLDPLDPSDGLRHTLHRHYTNVEVFINSQGMHQAGNGR